MALKSRMTLKSGVTLFSAYHKIEGIEVNYKSGKAWVSVLTYAAEEPRRSGLAPVMPERRIEVPVAAFDGAVGLDGMRAAGYVWLKGHEFAGAADA